MEEILLSVTLGIGLAAACGFRIFVPLLVMSVAARAEYLSLGDGFDWIGSTPALVVFGSATALEIGAYYIPFLDNLLDTIAGPTAVVAGVLVTATQISDLHPLLGWTLAIVGGGGAAGAVQGITTVGRQVSAVATAGIGNPLVSTAEAGGSLLMATLAVVAPVAALILLAAILALAGRFVLRRRRNPTALAA